MQKPRVSTFERERDREVPNTIGSSNQAASQTEIVSRPALGAPDDAFDQRARILVRHIERQGLAPAGPVQVEPGDGVEPRSVRGRCQVLLDPMQLPDKFGGHRDQILPERGWHMPGFLGGGLIRVDAARDEIKSALKPLVQPPAALNGAQRQAAFADQGRQIFVAAIFVPPHRAAPAAQAFADAGCHRSPVVQDGIAAPIPRRAGRIPRPPRPATCKTNWMQ